MSGTLESFDGGLVAVTLHGELDAHDAPELRRLFASALDQAGADGPRLLLDLSQVGFLDSTVLGSIVGLLRRTREAGGDLGVVLPLGSAVRIFEITSLDTILTTYPTRAAALEPS